MNKEQAYQELISDVKKFYIAQEAEHHDESVYLTWYDNCEEINLWTYWQGRGSLDAKIMLVGQDWGSPADVSEHYMAQFAVINAGSHQYLPSHLRGLLRPVADHPPPRDRRLAHRHRDARSPRMAQEVLCLSEKGEVK